MEDVIVFAEPIGKIGRDQFVYRFLFSDDPDIIWGDNFNVTPAGGVPNIKPFSDGLTKEWRVVSNEELDTAVKSTWFSLQDCIDGIISLVFSKDEESKVVINFGENIDMVRDILTHNKIQFQEFDYQPEEEIEEKEGNDE